MKEYELRSINLLKALSNSVRYLIVKLLIKHGELSSGQISRMLNRKEGRISSHLKRLKDVGLVRFRTEKTFVYYRLKREEIKELIEFVEKAVKR